MTAVYGLDIETDTDTDGLDPLVGAVIAVAVSTADGDVVVDGEEAALLSELDRLLAVLPAGVLVTWNGSRFDLPYLATRAALCGVHLGLTIEHDEVIDGYRGRWHHHGHLDAYRLFRADVGPALHVSCSLKSIARLAGLDPVEVDASRVHELATHELHRYVASDARCARELAIRRGAAALRGVDKVEVAPSAPGHLPLPLVV